LDYFVVQVAINVAALLRGQKTRISSCIWCDRRVAGCRFCFGKQDHQKVGVMVFRVIVRRKKSQIINKISIGMIIFTLCHYNGNQLQQSVV
jgi:hypothetical protein